MSSVRGTGLRHTLPSIRFERIEKLPPVGDAPLGTSSALPCPAGRSVPGRGGPERRRRPRPDGTETLASVLGRGRSGTTENSVPKGIADR